MVDWVSKKCSAPVMVTLPDGTTDTVEVATIQGFECIVQVILNLVVRFAGIALFIMLVIGGFKYLTSGGNPEETGKAAKTITTAILGMILLLGAWLIILLIQEITGVSLTQFAIPGP